MDEHKICFIISYNNQRYLEECGAYIQQLRVPEGYETDLISIKDANSMAEAYNAAMESSDAKYKVYLHQDLFILHEDFLQDILRVFQKHEELGLLGMVGGVELPEDAALWKAWNRGCTYANNGLKTVKMNLEQEGAQDYTAAEAVDGMIMVTQYDLPWREDLGLGWDFYDISQSLEFRRKGYQVGIPVQDTPWCLHDCGSSKLKQYDRSRRIILEEYRDFFGGQFEESYLEENFLFVEEKTAELKDYVTRGAFEQVLPILQELKDSDQWNTELSLIWILTSIYQEEQQTPEGVRNFFAGLHSFEEMKEKYTEIKLGFMWLEHFGDAQIEEGFAALLKQGEVSAKALFLIGKHNTRVIEKVWDGILARLQTSSLQEPEQKDGTKIAFIICAWRDAYYEECLKYLQELELPEGYRTEVIRVEEAQSRPAAYQAAMEKSDAKYKVYLQEGTFIINKRFLYDILDIFQSNEPIGMMGMLGSRKAPEQQPPWEWELGNAVLFTGKGCETAKWEQSPENPWVSVSAIDDFIIITQKDMAWQTPPPGEEERYAVLHCHDFISRGLQIVTPYQETPWCYHMRGVALKGLEEVRDVRQTLLEMWEKCGPQGLLSTFTDLGDIAVLDDELWELRNLLEVYLLEEHSITGLHSSWLEKRNWQELYDCCGQLRLTLLRLAYQGEEEAFQMLKRLLQEGCISEDFLGKFAAGSLPSTSVLYERGLLSGASQEPLVSVIVCVYNGEAFVADTLQSILGQTYRNLEVIVVDDCSTDSSRQVIASFHDSRIKPVFLEKNRNVCNAGNVGFLEARGKYVALIGHDDIWVQDKLEKQVAFLEAHPAYGCCFTWTNIIDENGREYNYGESVLSQLFGQDNQTQEAWCRRLFIQGNALCAPSACIRRAVLEEIGIYRYGLLQLQDYDLWMRLTYRFPIYILQERLTRYRRFQKNSNNISTVNDVTMDRDRHETQWIQHRYLEEISDERFRQIFGKDLRRACSLSPKEVLCEKAFLLWQQGNCFAEKWFLEILEDAECRSILEEAYQFTLQDFYRMNGEARLFDGYYYRRAVALKALADKLQRSISQEGN